MPTRRTRNGRFSAPDLPDRQSLTTERTGRQMNGKTRHLMTEKSLTFGHYLYANGGYVDNPMGFPGYETLYTGSFETYRWMLQHPVLRLVRAIAVAAILASSWNYKKVRKNASDEWTMLVRDQLDGLRFRLLMDFFVRGRDMGVAVGEPIWELRDGLYWMTRVKPLSVDITDILQDQHGNFTGFRQRPMYSYPDPTDRISPRNGASPTNTDVQLAAPYKAFKFTYDGEAGYHWGRSWLENVRATAWKDWLDGAQQLQKLGAKISGIIAVIMSPAGTFPAADGVSQVSYQANAEAAIRGLAEGAAGVWFPSLGLTPDAKGNLDAMKVLVELAGKSLTNINVLDFGSQSPAITGILDRMKHDEELMFMGGLRPSRMGLESKVSARADAEQHTDTGLLIAVADDYDFADQCQALANAILVANFGDRARDSVRIDAPSLVDRKQQLIRAILLAGLNNPDIAQILFTAIDMDRNLAALDLDTRKPFDAASLEKIISLRTSPPPAPAPNPASPASSKLRTKKNVEPQGGKPKGNK